VEALAKGFDEGPLFKNFNLLLEVGEKIAILGANGVGKSTMLKTLVGELQPDNGTVKWSENAQIGYYAQDHEYEFENDLTVFDWMSQWKQEGDDEQAVRSILGRLLFSQDDQKAGESALRWRERPHAVRQADDGKTEYSGDGRTDQPPGYGIDRIAEHGAGDVSGHPDFRFSRP
jgi:ABC-type branched-subunit amino acid transport system ATPase component